MLRRIKVDVLLLGNYVKITLQYQNLIVCLFYLFCFFSWSYNALWLYFQNLKPRYYQNLRLSFVTNLNHFCPPHFHTT